MSTHPAADYPWQTYRDIRLRALEADPSAFGSTLERERAFTDGVWADRAMSPGTYLWVSDDEPAASSGFAPRADGLIGLRPASGYLDDPVDAALFGAPIDHLAFVVQMWVTPARRGSGIFDDLLDAVIDHARRDGVTTLALHVMSDNARATAAYRRRGFVRVEVPQGEGPQAEDAYALSLA